MQRTCSIDGCQKAAARGGLCWSHIKRRQRHVDIEAPLRVYGQPSAELVKRAALRYAEAADDEEFARARALLLKHAKAYGIEVAARRRKRSPAAESALEGLSAELSHK